MKKKLLAALLAVSMVMSLCACGSDKETTSESAETTESTQAGVVSSADYNVDDYVTVGDYSGLEVTADVVTFTDEDVETQFNEEVEYYVEYSDLYTYTKTDKTVVESGDITNIDYVGKKDGVAFDGGTAQGHHLEIGSGSFIDGFEDGLIGKNVGETTTLHLTFPEDYGNEELAGAAVTFDVTIHSIDEREMPEVNDALIAQMDIGFDTIDAYKADIKTYLQEECDDTNKSNKETAVWDAVYALCTISDPPQDMVDDIRGTITQNAEMYAQYYGVTMEEFVTTYMGYTMEAYEEECNTSAIESAKQRLAVAAVAKKGGIELTEEEVKAKAEEEYEEYGYESADALLANIGEGAYYDYILTEKVYEYLATCVTIKEGEPVSVLAEEEVFTEEEVSGEEISTGEEIPEGEEISAGEELPTEE